MTDLYKKGEKYFTEVNSKFIDQDLPESVRGKFGYPIDLEVKVKDVFNIIRELTNGNYVVSIQIAPYDNYIKGSTTVKDYITESDFEIAKQMFEKDKFYTLSEYKKLDFKELE